MRVCPRFRSFSSHSFHHPIRPTASGPFVAQQNHVHSPECSPLLKDLQCEVQQLSLALLPPLDHFQDGDCSAQIPAELQHLLVGRLIVLTVLNK